MRSMRRHEQPGGDAAYRPVGGRASASSDVLQGMLVRFLKLHVMCVTAVSLAQSEQANSMHQRTQHVYGENSVAARFMHIRREVPEFLRECAHSP